MEIFSYILEGALVHNDSMGNGRQLTPGQIQLMSSNTGITHSEFNPSRIELGSLLQVWIKPHTLGLVPSYTEWHPSPETKKATKVLVISADGCEKLAIIHQVVDVYQIRLMHHLTPPPARRSGR